jgi:hypothetical protein
MRTDADDPACVRDPAIELLLSHTATLTDEWCSRSRARRHGLRLVEAEASATLGNGRIHAPVLKTSLC